MRFFSVLALSIGISFSAFASTSNCVDINGKYKWISEDEETVIELTAAQENCRALRVIYDMGGGFEVIHRHIFDGVRRLVEENDGFKAFETATISKDEISIKEERFTIDDDDGTEHKYGVNFRFFLTAEKNLVIERITLDAAGVVTDTTIDSYTREH